MSHISQRQQNFHTAISLAITLALHSMNMNNNWHVIGWESWHAHRAHTGSHLDEAKL